MAIAVPTARTDDVAPLLRRLFRVEQFRTRRARMGSVVRISGDRVAYYRPGEETTAVDLPL